MSAPSATPSAALAPRQFAAIAAIMQAEARIHLAPSKVTLIESRLARRVREHGLASFADYVALVESDPAERGEMVASLTTNHTHFFREAHHFDHVRDTLSPALRERAARRAFAQGGGERIAHMVEMMRLAEEMRVVGGERGNHFAAFGRVAFDQRDIVRERGQPVFAHPPREPRFDQRHLARREMDARFGLHDRGNRGELARRQRGRGRGGRGAHHGAHAARSRWRVTLS